ncbi:basic membrane protein A [Stackebrandtia albiflava]|uniref:Basic membrane protein A n=1 Tax=Stackebrandtia albiflava TaxID=406432 RepID=A0A562V3V9_9ACTN|nr:BMP family ABC transporter substrate-binding protein [Stackebrandtia albiflava]TWJ12566.1 basic membrane protein A [Stackebrandtia albiflava]
MSRRVRTALTSLVALGAVTLTACGEAPDESGSDGGDFQACMITDTGGVDDRSFNQSVWQGLNDAAESNGDIEPSYLTSASEADYEPNLSQAVSKGCEVVVAVGGVMTDATRAAAEANPDVFFVMVDGLIDLPNVYSVQFDTAQPAFLAGYLAAGTSETGKVATFGGMKIPPVTIFMDGFAEGVAHYNREKDADVQVLGWNPETQEGSFADSFTDQSAGRSLTQNFLSQDADVILPVAGNAALGAPSAAEGTEGAKVIWVDFDGCEAAEQYCALFLTSVMKNIPPVVADTVTEAQAGENRTGSFIGTLENDGVGLAPYHELESEVPAGLADEVSALREQIIDGTITVDSPASP